MGLDHGQYAYALDTLRASMTRIHEGGNIYYDRDRMAAYIVLARIASEMRSEMLRRYA